MRRDKRSARPENGKYSQPHDKGGYKRRSEGLIEKYVIKRFVVFASCSYRGICKHKNIGREIFSLPICIIMIWMMKTDKGKELPQRKHLSLVVGRGLAPIDGNLRD